MLGAVLPYYIYLVLNGISLNQEFIHEFYILQVITIRPRCKGCMLFFWGVKTNIDPSFNLFPFMICFKGMLDVARRTYNETVDDISGRILYVSFVTIFFKKEIVIQVLVFFLYPLIQ